MNSKLKFGSVCSGIEASSVAWHPLGWEAAWLAEIEPFPSAVLKHHYPNVLNLGDMTTLPNRIRAGEVEAPDLFCGGTPCQAFSIAGLRQSLNDARGNLSLTFCEVADAIDNARSVHGQPGCVVFWENVPGVLSTADNAFGCFLAQLCGGDEPLTAPDGWPNAGCVSGPRRTAAWRILDAQYFGLAQRRRRVFVVASSRNDFDPAKVLFEFDGVRRDTAPSREAGQTVAAGTRASSASRDWPAEVSSTLDTTFGAKQGLEDQHVNAGCPMPTGDVSKTVSSRADQDTASCVAVAQPVAFHPTQDPISSTDGSTHAMGCGSSGGQASVAVAHEALYNQGFTQGAANACTQETHAGTILRTLREAIGEKAFAKWGLGILDSLQSPEVLRQALYGVSIRPASFSRSWVVHCALSRSEDGSDWLLQSLREAGGAGCSSQGWEPPEQLVRELGAYLSKLSQPGAQATRLMRDLWTASEGSGLLRQALSAVQEVGRPTLGQGQPAHGAMQVRRLTVEECEFLQGFPRGYTAIPWRGKPADQCPDGPRYKALGNSWAVPVVRWIGDRINKAFA